MTPVPVARLCAGLLTPHPVSTEGHTRGTFRVELPSETAWRTQISTSRSSNRFARPARLYSGNSLQASFTFLIKCGHVQTYRIQSNRSPRCFDYRWSISRLRRKSISHGLSRSRESIVTKPCRDARGVPGQSAGERETRQFSSRGKCGAE